MTKEKKYEKPELKMLFNDLEAAMGACAGGNSDSAFCTAGNSPGLTPPCAGGTSPT